MILIERESLGYESGKNWILLQINNNNVIQSYIIL